MSQGGKNMPKETFFNLNQKKRNKIIEAAKNEFTANPLRKSRVSNIIKEASIPRGSFYQYFNDLDDLYYYVVNDVFDSIYKAGEKFCEITDNIFEFAQVSFEYNTQDSLGNEGSATVNVTIDGQSNDLTYVSESAGYHNVVGYYEVDDNGNPIDPSTVIVIDDQNGMESGTHLADLDPNANYGFFIIANGANEIDSNSTVTFDLSGAKPILLIVSIAIIINSLLILIWSK